MKCGLKGNNLKKQAIDEKGAHELNHALLDKKLNDDFQY